jgi:hypothetical protein
MAVYQADRNRCLALLVSSYRFHIPVITLPPVISYRFQKTGLELS